MDKIRFSPIKLCGECQWRKLHKIIHFYNEKQLSQLLDNCQSDTRVKTVIADIESRDGTELKRLCGLMVSSGLISEMDTDSDDISQILNNLSFEDAMCCMILLGTGMLTVKNATTIQSTEYGDVYPMSRKPRGYCVIIDNEYFEDKELSTRFGTTADVSLLTAVFHQLFFDIKLYNNKSANQMKTLLADIAADSALVRHDALAVIMLSHGADEAIYGTDGVTVNLMTILEMFNNENCPQLIDKPKMFFINACRGVTFSFGARKNLGSNFTPLHTISISNTPIPNSLEADYVMRKSKTDPGTRKSLGPNLAAIGKPSTAPIVSTWSDMFVYFSTVEGYVSTRSMFTGSWFAHELANCLAESAHREHLHDLVTIEVAKRVSDRITEIDGRPMKQAIGAHIKGSVKKIKGLKSYLFVRSGQRLEIGVHFLGTDLFERPVLPNGRFL
ncbi:unnamed protein product [Medioppia subpectinata]|uniref:Uncharacterized protein n=1 Tax=Medioppia subpectinata TaxID=1979941 RepID=A0A7R9KU94_9ACAR|nr:unnamed protein product [Medioppia subpectinata]CAG2108822.1 unnamed protein product [Medioppia subpectinata]